MDAFQQHDSAAFDAAHLQQLLLQSEDLEGFLTELAKAAASSTGLHCGITARGEGGPYTVASSNEVIYRLDELQYADGDGPCLEAMRTGVVVTVPDMLSETRWGPYPGQAAEIGVRSSLSYPLLSRGRNLGALNLYSFDLIDPQSDLQPRIVALAGHAGGALDLALRHSDQSALIGNLQHALTARSTIDQAIGILMAQQRSDARTAFDLLKTASQRRNIKLRDVAAQIVDNVQQRQKG